MEARGLNRVSEAFIQDASLPDSNDWAAMGLLAEANREEIHDALVGGKKLPDIQQELLRKGVKADTAETLILGVAGELVKSLVVVGVNPQLVRSRLTGYGLNDDQIARVLTEAMGKHERRLRSAGVLFGKKFRMGTVCFGIGIVFIVPARLGVIPIGFRFIGWLFLVIGTVLIGYHHLMQRGLFLGRIR